MTLTRCLVTGAAGFVGSHLVDRLLAEGCHVVGLDNFYTGFRRNIAHLASEPRFTLIEHDVTERLPELGRVQWIFNLACPASPPHYQRDPVFTTLTCFHGALYALELAEAQGARLLQASTSEVYGDPRVHPQPESYRGFVNCVGPRACYDEGKRVAETLCAEFRQRRGVDARIARIFNTYGPRMDLEDGRALPNFLKQALLGQPLTVYGDGQQTRSFCYVDDLIDGIVRLLYSDEHLPVNIGNPVEMTVLQFAETINKVTGNAAGVVFLANERSERDPQQRQPDITRARSILGWEPKIGVEEGLRRTIPYFKEKLGLA